jgi:hypothetical protein
VNRLTTEDTERHRKKRAERSDVGLHGLFAARAIGPSVSNKPHVLLGDFDVFGGSMF